MRVRMKLTKSLWIAAIALSIGIPGASVSVAASPTPQEQRGQDYSKYKNYQHRYARRARMTQLITRDHSKKRNTKKTKTRKPTRLAIRQPTRIIHEIISRQPC